MKWPIKIALFKESTREDAKHPQEDEYPSGSVLSEGYMWDYTQPKLGNKFYVMESKLYPNFRTSSIQEILETTDEYIRFRTKNSVYKVLFK